MILKTTFGQLYIAEQNGLCTHMSYVNPYKEKEKRRDTFYIEIPQWGSPFVSPGQEGRVFFLSQSFMEYRCIFFKDINLSFDVTVIQWRNVTS